MTLPVHTWRLTLRRLTPEDWLAYRNLVMDRTVQAYIAEPRPEEEVRRNFERHFEPWDEQDRSWQGLAVIHKSDQTFVGKMSYVWHEKVHGLMEIGYKFRPECHGQGFATEATAAMLRWLAETIKPHKFIARCDPDNIASWRVMEKVGMTREGMFKSHYRVGDHWTDEWQYGLLASEL